MSFIRPKRLFDVKEMKTYLYADISNNVEKLGYAAASHVWGDQEHHNPEDLGIKGGVDWNVPLSDVNKISRLVNAVLGYKMRYMWLDVLCMPQDKQDEINLEIPLMGDYYAGAVRTFVLMDPNVSMPPILHNGFKKVTQIARVLPYGAAKVSSQSFIFMIEEGGKAWLTRKWTFQEAVMSKKIKFVTSNGCYVNYSNVLDTMVEHPSTTGVLGASNDMFKSPGLAHAIKDYRQKKYGLGKALYDARFRQCKHPEDKFYGILGVLGYKNFSVEYDTDMEHLNLRMIKYACTLGDMSWLALDSDNGMGLIRQLHGDINYIGDGWERGDPNLYNVIFGDNTLRMNACTVAIVTECDTIIREEGDIRDGNLSLRECAVKALEMVGCVGGNERNMYILGRFRKWGFSDTVALRIMLGYREVSDEDMQKALKIVEREAGLKDSAKRAVSSYVEMATPFVSREHTLRRILADGLKGDNICQATYVQKDGKLPLIVYGKCDVGDKVVALPLYDNFGRGLAVIVDDSLRRKGICLYPKAKTQEDMLVLTQHEFLL